MSRNPELDPLWEACDDDRLLDYYFGLSYSMADIMDLLKRPIQGIKHRRDRLVTGVRSCGEYKPVTDRVSRPGGALSMREKKAVQSALFGAGQSLKDTERKRRMTAKQIAIVLNRPIKLINKFAATLTVAERKPLC